MKYEIITLQDEQVIGMSKEIAFNNPSECSKFWGEYVERIVKPIYMEGKEPDEFQKAAVENNVGEFGLCTCRIPNHNCGTCAATNFTACNTKTFTYVIGGFYKGGDVPEGMSLYPIKSGRWLKVHFEGGMAAFQQQFAKFHGEWLPAHPGFKWADNACSMEWYRGTDISSPDYQCGIMMPLAERTWQADVAEEIISIVEREEKILSELDEDVICGRYNVQNRNIKMIVGHLVDSASNNQQRIVRLQYAPRCGWSMPDANVGMLVFPDYTQDNDLWISLQDYSHYDWKQLIQLWKYTNLHMAHIIRNIDVSKLDNYWIDYQGNRCTLVNMAKGFAEHLNLHIGQIHNLIEDKL